MLKHEGFHPPCCLARLYTTKSVYVEKGICSKFLLRNSLTVLKTGEQCRKYHFPCLNLLNQTIPYVDTLSRTIPYPNTLSRTTTHLTTLSRTLS